MVSPDDRASAPPRQRRAWGTLSRAQIVAVALAIVRTEGLPALTIRRVATDLGASRMALYRHVPDKETLINLVLDGIAEQTLVPADLGAGPWPDQLGRLAAGIRRELTAYPGMVDLLLTHSHHGPAALRLVDTILRLLAAAGLDDRQAAHYYLVFTDLLLGHLRRNAHGDPVQHHRTATLHALSDQDADFPRLRAAEPHLRAAAPEHIFDTELEMLIDAIHKAAGRHRLRRR